MMHREKITDEVKRRKVDKVHHVLHQDRNKLLYEREHCKTRKAIQIVMQLAHDAKTSVHFGYFKTLSRIMNFHWKHKSRDVELCKSGCDVFQQKKTTWATADKFNLPGDSGETLGIASLRFYRQDPQKED